MINKIETKNLIKKIINWQQLEIASYNPNKNSIKTLLTKQIKWIY